MNQSKSPQRDSNPQPFSSWLNTNHSAKLGLSPLFHKVQIIKVIWRVNNIFWTLSLKSIPPSKRGSFYYSRTHVIRTLRDDDNCLNYMSFQIIGFRYFDVVFHANDGVCEKTDSYLFNKLFVCEGLSINHWQYFSECRPLSWLWIFKCKSV